MEGRADAKEGENRGEERRGELNRREESIGVEGKIGEEWMGKKKRTEEVERGEQGAVRRE